MKILILIVLILTMTGCADNIRFGNSGCYTTTGVQGMLCTSGNGKYSCQISCN